jgi:hypothetical protein
VLRSMRRGRIFRRGREQAWPMGFPDRDRSTT